MHGKAARVAVRSAGARSMKPGTPLALSCKP